MASNLSWKNYRKATAKATARNVKFSSEHTCCKVTMLETNITGYKLRLPIWFSRHILVKKGKLILEERGGKTWRPTYFQDNSRIVLSKEWIKFVRENGLKVGDACGFELLSSTNPVKLRVTIFRTSGGDQSSGTPEGFRPERPHFFKLILEESLQKDKLLIPPKFVKLYGHDMASYARVQDPSGREWKMEWSTTDGKTWFRDGWKQFADHYSLVHGSVLFFQYQGNSEFSVAIIDKSGMEIMYPVARANDAEGSEELDMEETDEDSETDEKSKEDEAEETFEKAESFNSKYPFFSIVLQQSSIWPISARLFVPPEFYSVFINEDEGEATLCSNGGRWVVKYLNGESRAQNKNLRERKGKETMGRPSFGSGWKQFADDNYLEPGDVCVFELIKRTSVTFKVHIFRGNRTIPSARKRRRATNEEDGNKKPNTRSEQQKKHNTIKSEDTFSHENPSFVVSMAPRFLTAPYLDIPKDFVEKNFKLERKEALLLVGITPWTVQFCPPGRFCSGWYKFARGNSLQKGDSCVFELIDKANMVLKVHIYRDA